ncbi:hypothetical protein DFH09DRAFT_1113206 [Mycena vulgaris]|nr:hypothetical protein DFH09DRAFT_1113206 [Mycena vulgaris]
MGLDILIALIPSGIIGQGLLLEKPAAVHGAHPLDQALFFDFVIIIIHGYGDQRKKTWIASGARVRTAGGNGCRRWCACGHPETGARDAARGGHEETGADGRGTQKRVRGMVRAGGTQKRVRGMVRGGARRNGCGRRGHEETDARNDAQGGTQKRVQKRVRGMVRAGARRNACGRQGHAETRGRNGAHAGTQKRVCGMVRGGHAETGARNDTRRGTKKCVRTAGTRRNACAEWCAGGHEETGADGGGTKKRVRGMVRAGARRNGCAEWYAPGHAETRARNGARAGTQKHVRGMVRARAPRNTCAEWCARGHPETRPRNGARGDMKKRVRTAGARRNGCAEWCVGGHEERCADGRGTIKRVHGMHEETRARDGARRNVCGRRGHTETAETRGTSCRGYFSLQRALPEIPAHLQRAARPHPSVPARAGCEKARPEIPARRRAADATRNEHAVAGRNAFQSKTAQEFLAASKGSRRRTF